jgi:hypothetical protein
LRNRAVTDEKGLRLHASAIVADVITLASRQKYSTRSDLFFNQHAQAVDTLHVPHEPVVPG